MNRSSPRLRSRVTVASGPLRQRRSTWPAEAIAGTRDAADRGHPVAQIDKFVIGESFSDGQAYYPSHVAGVVRRVETVFACDQSFDVGCPGCASWDWLRWPAAVVRSANRSAARSRTQN